MVISGKKVNRAFIVADLMHDIALENPKLFNAEEAFTLGTLHEIGYKYTDSDELHGVVGGEILREQKYIHWKEIYYHGKYQEEYDSPLLCLLNYADLTVSEDGEIVNFQKRYNEICKLHGETSEIAVSTKKLMESLPEKLISLGLL